MENIVIPAFIIISILVFLRVLFSRYFWGGLFLMVRHFLLLVPLVISMLLLSHLGILSECDAYVQKGISWLGFIPEQWNLHAILVRVFSGIVILAALLVVLSLQLAYLRDLFTEGKVKLAAGLVNATPFPVPVFLGLLVSSLLMFVGLLVPRLINIWAPGASLPVFLPGLLLGVLVLLVNLMFAGFYPALILEGKRFWRALGSSISFGTRKFLIVAPFVLAYLIFMGAYVPVSSKGSIPLSPKKTFSGEGMQYKGVALRSTSLLHFWDNRMIHSMGWNSKSLEGQKDYFSRQWISSESASLKVHFPIQSFFRTFFRVGPLYLLCGVVTLLFTIIFCLIYSEMLARREQEAQIVPESPWPGFAETEEPDLKG